MSHTTSHLIYFSENQSVAKEVLADLSGNGHAVEEHAISPNDAASRLARLYFDELKAPIMLLVTSNFLKSEHCMEGALEQVKNWADTGWLIPVVAPGKEMAEDGSLQEVETTFERVSNIIPYMNFWQDRYLDLRKQKRNHRENNALDEEIKLIKSISDNVAEFLRFLRGIEHYTIEDFRAGAYAPFRRALGDHSVIETEPQVASISGGQALAEMIEENSAEIMAENEPSEAPALEAEMEEVPPETLANIPGMGLLEKNADPPTDDPDPHATAETGEAPPKIPTDIPGMDLLEKNADQPTDDPDPHAAAETGEAPPEIPADIPGMDLLEKDTAEPTDDPALDAEAASLMDELAAQQPSAPPHRMEDEMENGHQEGLLMESDDDELNSILDEVLAEEGLGDDDNFEFLPEDSDNPDEFNLDALLDENAPLAAASDQQTEAPLKENEVAVELRPNDDEESVSLKDGGKISPEEVLEHALDLFASGETEAGLSTLGEAVGNNAGNTTLRYYFAYAQARYAKDPQSAKSQLQTLLNQDPQHPEAWYLMGELAESQTDFEGARKCFVKAIEINPGYPDIHYRLGLLTIQYFSGEEKKAAVHFEQAIRQDAENADAEYALANLLNEQLGQPEKAAVHFERVIELEPEHPFAHYDLALLHHGLGNETAAASFYQKAAHIDPSLKNEQNDLAFGVAGEVAVLEPEIEELPDLENLAEAENGEPEAVVAIEPEPEPEPLPPGPVVLITGGTAGIGRATAEVFAREGYRVVVTGRREERLEEIKAHFSEAYSNDIQTLNFDVRDVEAVKNTLDTLPEEWKNVDILINNAGLSRGLAPIHEGKPEDWDTMIDTNVKGLLYLTRAIAPQMVARRSGHIINVASSAGKEVYPGGNVYCATKAAVETLTNAMRLDLFKHNVRVSQVSPGHVEETEFARVRFDWDEERAEKTYENFQPLKSSDVAEVIYFMATRPAHVNIQDIFMFGTQQAGSNFIDRSGRP